MTRARIDGLTFLLLGAAVFILFGITIASDSPVKMVDFRSVYYSARCLIQHHDPYQESEVLRVAQAEGGNLPWDNARHVMQYIYMPTIFSFTAPFGLLPWGAAHILWMTLTIVGLIFASLLLWNLGVCYSPVVSGVLIGFLLANSELLVVTGNAAGLAIVLCIVAVWCFLRERFAFAGILCLAISLAIKPQDSGLVWLYFLLAGRAYRKRALQSLFAMAVLSLPAVLWVWRVAPNWIDELHSSILALSAHGSLSDPSPASAGAHGLGMMVNLQTVFSTFWDEPRFYNPASYLVIAPLLLLWAFVTLRSRPTAQKTWLALAAIAPITLLPVYHRQVDAKLLLLAVPACAMLWAEGGRIGRIALAVTSAAIVLNGDLSWAILLALIPHLPLPPTELTRQFLIAIQVFPVPLTLLATGIFYLWIYVKRCSAEAPLPAAEVSFPQ